MSSWHSPRHSSKKTHERSGGWRGNSKATATRSEPQGTKHRMREIDWAEEEDKEEPEELDESAWQRRAQARLRQIHIGKARPEYRRYVHEIRPEDRTKSQPSTPDPYDRVSKRQFDRALGAWRRQLHDFDAPGQWQGQNQLLDAIDAEQKDRRIANTGHRGDRSDRENQGSKKKGGSRSKVQSSSVLTEQTSSSTGCGSPTISTVDQPTNLPRIPISLADGLGTETPPPRPRAQITEGSNALMEKQQWSTMQWMPRMKQQWIPCDMETPQKQSMWLIPTTRYECSGMGNESWVQTFQSSCGPSMGTTTVLEELPGPVESLGGYNSPRAIKECASEGVQTTKVFETPKQYETPRRGCWVTATPSPHQQYAYRANPLADEGDMAQFGPHVPPLPQFSGPSPGFSPEGEDCSSATDVMQAEAQQFLFPSCLATNFQFQPPQFGQEYQQQEFQQQDLDSQASGSVHPMAYYPSSQG